jgi:cellobiose PTS system EIIC component
VLLLAAVSALIYYPFFKVYEQQLLDQEVSEAEQIEQTQGVTE